MSFQNATRQNFLEIPKQSYTAGGRLYFEIPSVGLLSRLFLQLNGTMTTTLGTGSAALSERGVHNLFKRIRVIANSGASIFDVSGYGTYCINRLLRTQNIVKDSLFDTGLDSLIYAGGVAAGANTWVAGLEIPIAVNERDPIGLVLLQNRASTVTVEIEFNDAYSTDAQLAPVVVTGDATAAFSGDVGLMMEYFTVPRSKEDMPPINVLHQWIEQRDSLVSAGSYLKSLQIGNTYQKVIHNLTINKALDTADVEKLRILYNSAEQPYQVNQLTQLMLQRGRYGSDLPKGMFVHDWSYSTGLPALGTSRDYINSLGVTEFQSEITIKSGTSMTAGQCSLSTITEQLIVMQ